MQIGENICLANPCWNGGVCKSLYNNADFQCECPFGTSGKDCRTNTLTQCVDNNPCIYKNPCQNNGRCEAVTLNGILKKLNV